MDQANDIMLAISTYTDQIERYENLSTWFAAFTVGAILLMLICASVLMLNRDKCSRPVLHSGVLAGIFTVIPMLITLYLYTFAMNMRKVALYRGYLCFLERRWNTSSGADLMQFNEGLMRDLFSARSFPINGLGPAVMAFFVLAALVMSFGAALHFMGKIPASRRRQTLKIFEYAVMTVCILFISVCVYYLSVNDAVVANAIAHCEELAIG